MRHRKIVLRKVSLSAAAALLSILILSCPQPIDISMLNHVKDEIVPGVVITQPADGSSFASTVVVSGHVSDLSTITGESGQIASVRYSVTPALIPGGTVDIGEDGSFSFSFSTASFSTSVVVTIICTDWNGNEVAATISLVNEGAVPSFAALAGNKSVTLEWEPVPLSESYSVYYTTNGTYPSESYGYRLDNVDPPLTLNNLQNGSMHVFLLQSHSSAGVDNWSDMESAIPLSPLSLVPDVEPEYEQLRVTWPMIPATDQFEVWRSTDGVVYSNYAGTITGNELVDSSLQSGMSHYYKVRPALDNADFSLPGSGTPSPFPPQFVQLRGSLVGQLADDITSIALDDHYVYAALYTGGIVKLDISQPGSPVIVGQTMAYSGDFVAISGDRLYVSDTDLYVLNKSDLSFITSAPGLGGQIVLGNGVAVIGVSDVVGFDPASPDYLTVLGTFAPGNQVQDSRIDGDDFYFTAYGAGLHHVDIDPVSPAFCDVTLITNLSQSRGIDIRGDRAFVGDQYSGLRVIDIADGSPTFGDIVHTYFPGTTDNVRWVRIHGDYAYVDDFLYTLSAIDISDPLAPATVATHSIFNYVQTIEANGRFLCVADDYSLKLFDIANPSTIAHVDDWSFSSIYSLDLHAGNLYANSSESYVISLVDPIAPTSLGTFPYFEAIDFAGDVALTLQPLESFNVSNPSAPISLGSAADSRGERIYVSSGYAYLAQPDPGEDQPHGLHVYDVTDPALPSLVAFLNGLDGRAVDGNGDILCLSSDYGDMHAFNVSDPASPVLLESTVGIGGEGTLVVKGDRAFFGDWSGLAIIDLDPSSSEFLTELGAYPGVSSYGFDISGNYALVGGESAGFLVLDVSDPAAIQLIYEYTGITAYDVVVNGRYVYVGTDGGLSIFDLLPE